MGKKKKGSGARAKPNVKGLSVTVEGAPPLDSKNLGLLNNLNSKSAQERAVSCEAVSTLLFQCDTAQRVGKLCRDLTQKGIIARLVQILTQKDKDLGVLCAAAKSLRNFSLVGGPAACDTLVSLRLPAAIKQLFQDDGIKATSPAITQRLFIHIFPLLAALASNQEDKAIADFMDPSFLHLVFAHMAVSTDTADANLKMEAISFLWVVTEDNVPLATALLAAPPQLQSLQQLLLGADATTRSAAAGVLMNCVRAGNPPAAVAASITTAVLDAVASLLDYPAMSAAAAMIAELRQHHEREAALTAEKEQKQAQRAALREAAEELEGEPVAVMHMSDDRTEKKNEPLKMKSETKGDEDDDEDDDEETKAPEKGQKGQKKLDADAEMGGDAGITQNAWEKLTWTKLSSWRNSVQGLKQALEVLTNLVTASDETKEAPGVSEFLGQELVRRQLIGRVSGFLTCGAVIPPDTEFNVEKVHRVLAEGFSSVFSSEEASSALSMIHSVRTAAASCAANLCLHLPPTVLGDVGSVVQQACTICSTEEWGWTAQEGKLEADSWALKDIEAFTTLIWNALRKGAPLQPAHLQYLLGLARRPLPSEEVRVNVAGMLGTIGTTPSQFEHNFVIGGSLLGLLEHWADHPSAVCFEVATEAVNSIIDVYTEDNVHTAQINQLQLLPKLAAFLPVLTKRYKQSRSKLDPLLQDRVEETLENLSQFIQYKKLHI